MWWGDAGCGCVGLVAQEGKAIWSSCGCGIGGAEHLCRDFVSHGRLHLARSRGLYVCTVYLLNPFAVVKRPVTFCTEVMVVHLVLPTLLLIGPGLVTLTALVFKMVLDVHMLEARVVCLEESIAAIALEKACVASGVAVLIARNLRVELPTTGCALVAARGC